MRSTRSRLAAAAAGALLVATLAGCGGSEDKKDDSKASSGSTTSASPEPSDGASEPSASGSAGSPETDAFADKLLDAMRSKKTAHMVINVGSSVTVNADIRYLDDGTAMKMRMTQGPTTVEVILLGETMYVQQQPGGKYTKVDKNTPGMGEVMSNFTNLGPEASVEAMKGSIKSVDKVGSAKVDGEKLTKYRLTVDTAGMTKLLGAAASTTDLPKTLTYTMYLDDEDLLRRADMEVAGQKLVLKVSDWGKPVDIKAPPAAKIAAR